MSSKAFLLWLRMQERAVAFGRRTSLLGLGRMAPLENDTELDDTGHREMVCLVCVS